MPHAYHQLYYHFVWATQHRAPVLHPDWRPRLLEILENETAKRGGHLIRVNAMPDHVHLLVRLPPSLAPAAFIGPVKGASSFRVNRELQPAIPLAWQEGYGVLSLRKNELPRVARYIDRQEEHHAASRVSSPLETVAFVEEDPSSGGSHR